MNIPNGLGLRKEAEDREKNVYDEVGAGEAILTDAGAASVGSLLTPTLLGGRSPLPAHGITPALAHMLEDGSDKEGLSKASPWSLIPGVGSYRQEKRHMYVDNKLSKGKNIHKSRLAELLGTFTSSLPLAAILGGVGAATAKNKAQLLHRAAIGATAALTPSIIGYLVGLLRKRRTNSEHREYLENGPLLSQYLIPGVAGYNVGRRARMAKTFLP